MGSSTAWRSSILSAIFLLGAGVSAESASYTVNGAAVAPEMGALLKFYGFQPGAYYIDARGNYGMSGQPPSGNFHGGPIRGWSGVEPRSVRGNPYALAYVNGVTGVRVFWVYSPSIFSDVKGGSSGYVHICPGNIYHRTHEGAISGGTDSDGDGLDNSWFGVAGQSAQSGRWRIERGQQGPVLALYAADGGAQRVPVATMMQGSWTYNRVKYAAEQGKASC